MFIVGLRDGVIEFLQEKAVIESNSYTKIPVGARLIVDIDGVCVRMESFYIGRHGEECLIVSTPETTGVSFRPQYFSGRQITCRYLLDGELQGFKAVIRQAIDHPMRLLFLWPPNAVEQISLRKSRRFAAFVPVELEIEGRSSAAVMLDISSGGCRCRVPLSTFGQDSCPDVDKSSAVTIHASSPVADGPIQIAGVLRHAQCSDRSMQLGIAFDRITAQARDYLRSYLSTLAELVQDNPI